jgi:protein SCO1/2
VRWLKAPDKLLAEKDPLAVALYYRYNKVMMPNLRLSDLDIESVLDYMTSHDKDQAALALHR